MKRLLLVLFIMMLFAASLSAQQAAEITFTFTHQSGHATNQFAVWVEDAQGQYIKTLYATRFTANGGFIRRTSSIPTWVKKSNLEDMNKAQIDAISRATPKTGALSYTWDGTNSHGTPVPEGDYTLVLEGTLRWENQVMYRANVQFGKGASAAEVKVEYTGDASAERSMLSDVKARTLR